MLFQILLSWLATTFVLAWTIISHSISNRLLNNQINIIFWAVTALCTAVVAKPSNLSPKKCDVINKLIYVVTCWFIIPLRTSGGKTIPYHSFFGDIEFKNVSFTYPTRPDQVVVENLSLSIKGGQMVSWTHKRNLIVYNNYLISYNRLESLMKRLLLVCEVFLVGQDISNKVFTFVSIRGCFGRNKWGRQVDPGSFVGTLLWRHQGTNHLRRSRHQGVGPELVKRKGNWLYQSGISNVIISWKSI